MNSNVKSDAELDVRSPAIPPVGTIARRTRTVTTDDIARFTDMTGDRNPLHYDQRVAEASRFGGIIVQGGVTSGLLNAIVAEQLPGPGSVFLHVDWSFIAPVRPGDQITAEVEVLQRRDDKPIGTIRTTITDQHGTVVLDGTAVVYREALIGRALSGHAGFTAPRSIVQLSGTGQGISPSAGDPLRRSLITAARRHLS